MTRRRWLLLVSLAVLGLGVWFYLAYFAIPGAALERAEAFLFRRMTVAQLGEQGTYRFFFATNRADGGRDLPMFERFGSNRAEELKYGYFDTRIEPSLGLGMLINPTQWFQDEEITIETVRPLEREEFVAKLTERVAASSRGSLLVVVHGFRERFPSALRKTAFIGHVLDINSPVLLFDWPGNQGSSPRGYLRARQVAEASGAELAATLRLVIDEIDPDRLWLFANSLGAQVVADAFGILYADPKFADAEEEFEDVVLTAPDVEQNAFDERFKDEITALADKLTVYVSSNDRALVLSRIINRAPRRGESSLSPDQLEEAVRIAELIEPGDDRMDLVDVTPVNRTRNFHSFSLETPEFFDDLFLRLANPETPESRLIYQIKTEDGEVYWVLTRGR
ncbi:MAG: alpha/beta fold hydrolase [Thiohalocapsa sp.]|jgi:esterase/lipase superfamily enzyme